MCEFNTIKKNRWFDLAGTMQLNKFPLCIDIEDKFLWGTEEHEMLAHFGKEQIACMDADDMSDRYFFLDEETANEFLNIYVSDIT